ncbi:FKBP-type peptidyl-prolyl cis-trans isomerase [Neolewinella persica]|uniref:FKBP-type peptidyl-prolyl cis-trans isomerase n=1 Tax=Neolewinella persica TaxID=70998 RepID=UPI00037517BC|nr:FKBP-type peptidyl-prolyl cis-trans isomerase [Neolewinella persica]
MRSIIFLLLASTLFYACGNEGGSMQRTDIGNRYQLFTANGGGDLVQPGDYVHFNAAMRTEGDSILFSTWKSGGELPVVQAAELTATKDEIGPVEDIVRQMRVGDSAVVRVNISEFPSKPPGMENDSVVLYDVVVSKIVSEADYNAELTAKQAEAAAKAEVIKALEPERVEFAEEIRKAYADGKLSDQIKTTESGLKYMIHEQGDGKQAEAGLGVTVQYIGQLVSDGTIFDQSFNRGEGIGFQLGIGRVIPGWDEGIELLKVGDKATFFIPSELAYGADGTPDGSIPGGSELAFYVELEDVQ